MKLNIFLKILTEFVMCYVNINYIVTYVTYNNKKNKEISKKDKGKQIIFYFLFFIFLLRKKKKKTVMEGFEHSMSGVHCLKGGNLQAYVGEFGNN
jgi:hypothetical protein